MDSVSCGAGQLNTRSLQNFDADQYLAELDQSHQNQHFSPVGQYTAPSHLHYSQNAHINQFTVPSQLNYVPNAPIGQYTAPPQLNYSPQNQIRHYTVPQNLNSSVQYSVPAQQNFSPIVHQQSTRSPVPISSPEVPKFTSS